MEIDVTHMVEDADEMFNLSGSKMEHGQNAGKITWNNSVAYGKQHPLLGTEDARDTARAYFKEFGAWSQEEIDGGMDAEGNKIDGWSNDELEGIMCQDVANAIREMEIADSYEEYVKLVERGTCSGNIYRGDNGRWYFYVGH